MNERRLAGAGITCVAAGLALYAWLHLAPPSNALDWQVRTISQYALLDNGWAFDTATLLLAAGSLVVLVALVRRRVFGPRSGAAIALALWVVGLVGVVVFEKHNWSTGPSIGGDIHRAASVVAFLSLPAAAILAALPWLRRPEVRPIAVAVLIGGVISLLCFSPILYALVTEPFTGVRWWRAIPLGLVERLLGLAEVLTVLLLACWAATAPQPVPKSASPGGCCSASGRTPSGGRRRRGSV